MRRVSGATGAAREELLLAQTLVGFLTFKIFHMQKNQKKKKKAFWVSILISRVNRLPISCCALWGLNRNILWYLDVSRTDNRKKQRRWVNLQPHVCLVKQATWSYELLIIQTSWLSRSLSSDGNTHECWLLSLHHFLIDQCPQRQSTVKSGETKRWVMFINNNTHTSDTFMEKHRCNRAVFWGRKLLNTNFS